MCEHKNTQVEKEFPNGDKLLICKDCGELLRECKNNKKKRWWKLWHY